MDPCPAERTKRSRSGQAGSAASNFRKRVQSTVAASAMPIGMPGWPDFAASTASIASARIAFAMGACLTAAAAGVGVVVMMLVASGGASRGAPLALDELQDHRG